MTKILNFLGVAAQLSTASSIVEAEATSVKFVVADFQGEEYRRLIEPMPQYEPTVVTCPSSQVHLTLGGSGPQSMTVSWVNPSLTSSSTVMFGVSTAMGSSASGTATAYTQLLSPSSGNLVNPSMGAPGASAAQIIALANSSAFAVDRNTGKRWSNYKLVNTLPAPGQLSYSNPYTYYDSPIIHTTVLTGLVAGMTYYYQPASACKIYSFTMTPAVNTYPFKAALVADLGTTAVSVMSVAVLAAMKASVVIFTGDLSYADGWVPTWDTFGLMIEPLAAYVPLLTVGGNHELGSTENWQSYAARYPTSPQDSKSPNFCYHGREVGPMNIISLCSYGAANFAGLNTGANSLQYQWLVNYLPTVDRTRTPWILVQFHVPMYCTNSGHYMEGEIFRRQYEPLLYKYGVDIVMNGHVHAYERSFPVYNNTVNPCGITHLVLGDGGNYENAYVPWNTPQRSWSAFREASFGVASLNVMSATNANYTWHRHACGSTSPGAPNYNMNFSSSCVTPKDNSINVAQAVDSYILTRPSMAACPNRYMTAAVMPPTMAPSMAPVVSEAVASSCFAGTETVQLESGESKLISAVKVGDRVLASTSSGKTIFSEVVYVPHKANSQRVTFAHITTDSGRDVKMTKNHILPSGKCGSVLPLVYASQVSVGECIMTVSGEERVSAVESVRGEGVYTIVTKEEYVVVNGIIASPFGVNHMMANLYYNMHRFIFNMAPALLASAFLQSVNDKLEIVTPLFGASPTTA